MSQLELSFDDLLSKGGLKKNNSKYRRVINENGKIVYLLNKPSKETIDLTTKEKADKHFQKINKEIENLKNKDRKQAAKQATGNKLDSLLKEQEEYNALPKEYNGKVEIHLSGSDLDKIASSIRAKFNDFEDFKKQFYIELQIKGSHLGESDFTERQMRRYWVFSKNGLNYKFGDVKIDKKK